MGLGQSRDHSRPIESNGNVTNDWNKFRVACRHICRRAKRRRRPVLLSPVRTHADASPNLHSQCIQMYWNRLQIYWDLCAGRVADWPQKWPIKSLIVQLLKSCPHLHTFEFFLYFKELTPQKKIFNKIFSGCFQSGTAGDQHHTTPAPRTCVLPGRTSPVATAT